MTSGQRNAPTTLLLAALTSRRVGAPPADPRTLIETARAAEQAGFTAALLHDTPSEHPGRVEAGTLAAGLAAVTRDLGLMMCTPPNEPAPYHLARITASLDHLSGGRAGWCVAAGGDPFDGGRTRLTTAEQAATAEYVEVVKGLWDSFDDNAFTHDRATGTYWRLDAVHHLDHRGEHYAVAGPLNVARPPQGHPPVAVTALSQVAQADLFLLDTTDVDEAVQLGEHARTAATAAGRAAGELRVIATLPADADADVVAGWTAAGAADGFLLPLDDADSPFLVTVVPELRRRGLLPAVPTEPATLRERLGLPRPARTTTPAEV
ncbi:LLM class flavin-dependent oxidoreductase [Streptomyces durbertensis]|uniref:LLM class flavin-dependent oxidoreductase n=1 Tax=Streptomyces durbertensis TaxID=2448886 RepID=A0ABR6EGE8_9ACTN|nr:LLM class flavin-dependent oxidoreductase [Streptomyces durbertensis]MBB1244406.1 LLM class flavin-dependent oxidoreductase [Streptomyces durbertensis]